MGGNRILEYVIKARDLTHGAVNSAKNGLRNFANSVKSRAKSIGSNLMNIYAGFQMLAGGVKALAGTFMNVMKSSFHFETITVQFENLIGDIDKARSHAEMLQELGDTPPFSLDEFASVSRAMMAMSGGALGFKESLLMVGDAASATGKPLQTVGEVVAKTYAMIRDGVDITATQLVRLGIVSPGVVYHLKEMQNAGKDSAEIWQYLKDALGKYSGSMDKFMKTGQGQVDTISGTWSHAVRIFGDEFAKVAKGGLAQLQKAMLDLIESGKIEVWAQKVAKALAAIGKAAYKVVDAMKAVYKWSGAKDVIASVKGIGRGIGTAWAGGSFMDTMNAVASAGHEGHFLKMFSEWIDPNDLSGLKKLNQEFLDIQQAKTDAAIEDAKAEKKKARANVVSAQEEKRIIDEQLAAAQEKLNAKKWEAEYEKQRVQMEADERKNLEQDFAKTLAREQLLNNRLVELKKNNLTPEQRGMNAAEFVKAEMAKKSKKEIHDQNEKDRKKAERRLAYLEKYEEKFKNGGKMSKKRQKELEALRLFVGKDPQKQRQNKMIELLNNQVNELRAARRKLQEALLLK